MCVWLHRQHLHLRLRASLSPFANRTAISVQGEAKCNLPRDLFQDHFLPRPLLWLSLSSLNQNLCECTSLCVTRHRKQKKEKENMIHLLCLLLLLCLSLFHHCITCMSIEVRVSGVVSRSTQGLSVAFGGNFWIKLKKTCNSRVLKVTFESWTLAPGIGRATKESHSSRSTPKQSSPRTDCFLRLSDRFLAERSSGQSDLSLLNLHSETRIDSKMDF